MKYWRAAAPGGGNVHANFLLRSFSIRGNCDYIKGLDKVLFNYRYSRLFLIMKNCVFMHHSFVFKNKSLSNPNSRNSPTI